jgi:phosphohistidine swiveling domain-containing protein
VAITREQQVAGSRVTSLGDERPIEGTSGDVLVIPLSDVGWTPLFAQAGAAVAESGGMLPHSSIVARTYGLPRVVSVAGNLPFSIRVVPETKEDLELCRSVQMDAVGTWRGFLSSYPALDPHRNRVPKAPDTTG